MKFGDLIKELIKGIVMRKSKIFASVLSSGLLFPELMKDTTIRRTAGILAAIVMIFSLYGLTRLSLEDEPNVMSTSAIAPYDHAPELSGIIESETETTEQISGRDAEPLTDSRIPERSNLQILSTPSKENTGNLPTDEPVQNFTPPRSREAILTSSSEQEGYTADRDSLNSVVAPEVIEFVGVGN